MICRLCENEKDSFAFQSGRKVCRSCRATKQRNPKTVRANSLRAWHKRYDESKEEWNARVREYRARRREDGNPIIRNCASDKYRKSGRIKFWIRAEVKHIYGDSCMYCLAEADTIDHVVSLNKGGDDSIENLVPACWSCNSSKQDRGLLQWLVNRRVG